MIFDRIRSFGAKLLWFSAVTSTVGVFLVCAASVALEWMHLRDSARAAMTTDAAMTATHSVSPLSLDDREAAKKLSRR